MASTLSALADLLEDENFITSASPKPSGMPGMKLFGHNSTSSVTYVLIVDYNTSGVNNYTQNILIDSPELYSEPLSFEPLSRGEYTAMATKQLTGNRTVAVRVRFHGEMDAVDTSHPGSLILEDVSTTSPLRRSRVVKARVTVVHGAPGSSGSQP